MENVTDTITVMVKYACGCIKPCTDTPSEIPVEADIASQQICLDCQYEEYMDDRLNHS